MPAKKPTSPAKGLTDEWIAKKVSATGKKFDVPDRGCRGLVLTVMPSGSRFFRWHLRALHRAITLGPWSQVPAAGHLTHDEAKRWMIELKAARRGGTLDAKETELRAALGREKRGQAIATAAPTGATVEQAATAFYEKRILPKRKRPEEAWDVLSRDIIKRLGAERAIASVTTEDLAALVEDVAKHGRTGKRGAPGWAHKVFGMTRQFFGWAWRTGRIKGDNPAARLEPDDLPIKVDEGDRWLTSEEIPLFWRRLDASPEPVRVERPDPRTGRVQVYEQRPPSLATATRCALRLLLLTGARSGELLRAGWKDVDLEAGTWTIPVENQKTTVEAAKKAKPFVIPLGPTALATFRELRALADNVPTRDGQPSPWVMASAEASGGRYSDKALGHAMRAMFKGAAALKLPGGPASPHDLRRTFRSHLGDTLGVEPHIAERCLNHSLGRIVKTYDQADYLTRRRAVIEKWDGYVLHVVTGEGAQIVPFARPSADAAVGA